MYEHLLLVCRQSLGDGEQTALPQEPTVSSASGVKFIYTG